MTANTKSRSRQKATKQSSVISFTKNGGTMQVWLTECGVPVNEVVRARKTGYHHASFWIAEMQTNTFPAAVWAQRIKAALTGNIVTVIGTLESYADWRPGNDVLEATVIFEVKPQTAIVPVGERRTLIDAPFYGVKRKTATVGG